MPQPLSDWQAACDAHYQDIWYSNFIVDENGLWNYTDAASAQNCKDMLQFFYARNVNDEEMQSLRDQYDFTPLVDGKYDVYFNGHYIPTGQQFEATFPDGLVVNTAKPEATIVTNTGDSSPALTGSVNDPTALVRVLVNKRWYIAVKTGQGTWYLPAGTVAALEAGTYDITVEVTNRFGDKSTTASRLTGEQAAQPVDSVSRPVGAVTEVLSRTGEPVLLVAGGAFIMLVLGGSLMIRRARSSR